MNILKIYDTKSNLIAMYCNCPWIWHKSDNKIIISDIVNGERTPYKCKEMFTTDSVTFHVYL